MVTTVVTAHGVLPSVIGMWLVVLPALVLAERANRSGPARSGGTFGDAPWFVVYLVVAPPIGWLADRLIGAVPAVALPLPLRIGVGLVVFDVVSYHVHRAMHRTGLWRWHAVHHASTSLSFWTAFRSHPVSSLVTHLLPVAVLAGLGLGGDAISVVVSVVFVVTLIGHADVWVPGPLERLVATPGYHRRHHEPEHGGHNLVLLFPLLDRLGGTAAPSGEDEPADRH